MQDKKWYAVYTRKQMEKQVCQFLRKNDISYSFPSHAVPYRDVFGKIRYRQEPLFKSCVFLLADLQQLALVEKCNHVVNFFFWLGRKVVIRQYEINAMEALTAQRNSIFVEKIPVRYSFQANGHHLSDHGKGLDDDYVQPSHPVSQIEMPSIGYRLTAMSGKEYLEKTSVQTMDYTYQLR